MSVIGTGAAGDPRLSNSPISIRAGTPTPTARWSGCCSACTPRILATDVGDTIVLTVLMFTSTRSRGASATSPTTRFTGISSCSRGCRSTSCSIGCRGYEISTQAPDWAGVARADGLGGQHAGDLCDRPDHLPGQIRLAGPLTLFCAAAALAGAWVSYGAARQPLNAEWADARGGDVRPVFAAWVGTGAGILFALTIVNQALASLILDGCLR